MPQDYPDTGKFVFISRNSSPVEAIENSHWLYLRLSYENFPVKSYIFDQAIGGGGFPRNYINVANPTICILSNSASSYATAVNDYIYAKENGIHVVLAIFEEVAVPNHMRDEILFDFRTNRENTLERLIQFLRCIDYSTHLKYKYRSTSDNLLSEARRFALDGRGASDVYRDQFYGRILSGNSSSDDKIAALYDLGKLKVLYGLVQAALVGDLNENVRGAAALALSRYENEKFSGLLLEARRSDKSEHVKLCAQIGLKYLQQPRYFNDFIDSLQHAFSGDVLVNNNKN